ncbi:hypothetical protein JOQ06_012999 [Pogonophryne albipinna]|uniref:Uncharacterized protein n=1 Tax=Pogonophryne albipinna TaxID=1090488 RepID=A0AAD6BI88_9TELE|nr:hypothetical protein JOQ06_012999 [Pogonophryne albipinna]
MSKYILITENFNITVHKFQQWERSQRAKLETKLWLPGLRRGAGGMELAQAWPTVPWQCQAPSVISRNICSPSPRPSPAWPVLAKTMTFWM